MCLRNETQQFVNLKFNVGHLGYRILQKDELESRIRETFRQVVDDIFLMAAVPNLWRSSEV